MSEMIIELRDLHNGFVSITVEDHPCGQIEDAEGELTAILKRILHYLQVENYKIVKR